MADPCRQWKHFNHPHNLHLETEPAAMTEPYTCNGCREIGTGDHYRCKESGCTYHLHLVCALADPNDPEVTHRFFPSKFKFRFLDSPVEDLNGRRCRACRRDVNGYNYQCDAEGVDVHPTCWKLPLTITDPDNGVELELNDKMSSSCFKCCKKKLDPGRGQSWEYVSRQGKSIHIACAKDMMLEAWEKYQEEAQTKVLSPRKPPPQPPAVCRSPRSKVRSPPYKPKRKMPPERPRRIEGETELGQTSTLASAVELAMVERKGNKRTFLGILKKAAIALVKNADKIVPIIVALVVSVVTGNPIPLSVAAVGNVNLFVNRK